MATPRVVGKIAQEAGMWPPIGWSFNGIADLNFGRAFFITGSGGTKRFHV